MRADCVAFEEVERLARPEAINRVTTTIRASGEICASEQMVGEMGSYRRIASIMCSGMRMRGVLGEGDFRSPDDVGVGVGIFAVGVGVGGVADEGSPHADVAVGFAVPPQDFSG